MEILGEIFSTPKEKDSNNLNFKIRKKAVGVITFGSQVCMIHSKKEGYYTLPGGGIDLGETPSEAVKREIIEETGLETTLREEIGLTIEYLYEFNVLQMTYSYLLKKGEKKHEISLTESEKEAGLEVQWVDIDEAIEKVKQNKLNHAGDIIMQKRALLLLEKAKKMMVWDLSNRPWFYTPKEALVEDLISYGEEEVATQVNKLTEYSETYLEICRKAGTTSMETKYISTGVALAAVEVIEGKPRPLKRKRRIFPKEKEIDPIKEKFTSKLKRFFTNT